MENILVVGSFVMDLMSRTPHMPSPGETVLGGPFQMGPGGKGGNQAVAAARLNADVTMVTKVGKDLFGDAALKNFNQENINTEYITRHSDETTGTALIAVDDSGENMIVVAPGACMKMAKEDIEMAEASFKKADIILSQLEISIEGVEATINLAHKLGKPLILNPAPYQAIDESLYKKIDYITPNETEASQLSGVDVVDIDSAREAAKKIYALGIEKVIITLGEKGSFVYDGTDEGELISSFDVDVIDTTGAGDAFNGALATYLARAYPLREAVKRANAVAALAVTKVGTAPAMPYEEEVEKAFHL